jgi:hypothetical protein
LEASQQFSFYRVGLSAPRPTPIPKDQASVFISPRGRVATHFSRLLWQAWVTVGLFLFPSHHTGKFLPLKSKYYPQHPVFKHPQSVFLPLCERSIFVNIDLFVYVILLRDLSATVTN